VDGRAVLGRLGPHGGVEHDVEGEGELDKNNGLAFDYGKECERRRMAGQHMLDVRKTSALVLTKAPAP
jgi:hypothetical protein